MVNKRTFMKIRGAREEDLRRRAIEALQAILAEVGLSATPRDPRESAPWDLVLDVPVEDRPVRLAVELKSLGEPARILGALGGLPLKGAAETGLFPLLFAPYVSERSAELCRRAGYGYFDEVGNCRIAFEAVRIAKSTDRKPPAERRRQRSPFAPKSSRVARALLGDPSRTWTQSELAEEMGISLGLVNRVVRRLEEDRFISRDAGRIRLVDGKALLDAWADSYSFKNNERRQCYTPEPLERFEERLDEASRREGFLYGLTLSAGANKRTPFVRTSRLAFYVDRDLTPFLEDLGLQEVSSGGNVLVVEPYDEGVFCDLAREGNTNVVSEVQIFLDLRSAGGREQEQAEVVAERRLGILAGRRSLEEEARVHEYLRLRDEGARLVREGRPAEGAPILAQAIEVIERIDHRDMLRDVTGTRIKLWIGWLQASFDLKRPELLAVARAIFPTQAEVRQAQELVSYNEAWVYYGLLLEAALDAIWAGEERVRRQRRRDYENCVKIVTSGYTAGVDEIPPLVEKIREWVEESGRTSESE